MTINFLSLRVRQIYRNISSVSWIYQLILLAMLSLAIIGLSVKSSQTQGSLILPILLAFAIGSAHWLRPDFWFLKINFSNYKWLLFTEYTLWSLPMLVGLLFSPHYYLAPTYLLFLTVLVCFVAPIRNVNKKAKALKFVPEVLFEWKSGLRRSIYPILLIWLAGLIFSYHVGIGIMSIFLVGLATLDFYARCEPINILLARQQGHQAYLWGKVKGLLLVSSMLYIPLLISFYLFHPAQWLIPTVITLVMLSYQIYVLTIKYAFFEPNTKSSRHTVLRALGALVLVLPFILPAIWVLTVKLYFQSLDKLKHFLDDFD